jgi:hypothetical protein
VITFIRATLKKKSMAALFLSPDALTMGKILPIEDKRMTAAGFGVGEETIELVGLDEAFEIDIGLVLFIENVRGLFE